MVIDLPHKLGKAEARRRIDDGAGGLVRHLPSGADVTQRWDGDRLLLDVALMGQEVKTSLDVRDDMVRVELVLPPALAFFGKGVEAAVRRGGSELLEDRSGKS